MNSDILASLDNLSKEELKLLNEIDSQSNSDSSSVSSLSSIHSLKDSEKEENVDNIDNNEEVNEELDREILNRFDIVDEIQKEEKKNEKKEEKEELEEEEEEEEENIPLPFAVLPPPLTAEEEEQIDNIYDTIQKTIQVIKVLLNDMPNENFSSIVNKVENELITFFENKNYKELRKSYGRLKPMLDFLKNQKKKIVKPNIKKKEKR